MKKLLFLSDNIIETYLILSDLSYVFSPFILSLLLSIPHKILNPTVCHKLHWGLAICQFFLKYFYKKAQRRYSFVELTKATI